MALMDCVFNALVSNMPENIADNLMDESVSAAAALTALASARAAAAANNNSSSPMRRIRGLNKHAGASSSAATTTPGVVSGVGMGHHRGESGGGSRSFTKSSHDDRMASIMSTSVRGRRPRILLPDLLIVFAICRLAEMDMKYRGYFEERRLEKEKMEEQLKELENAMVEGSDVVDNADNDAGGVNETNKEDSYVNDATTAYDIRSSVPPPLPPPPPCPPREDGLLLACLLAFRIYDGYQRQNNLTRDTLQRFLSDIHGEESYKTRGVRNMLDRLFTAVVTEPRRKLEPHEDDSAAGGAAPLPRSTTTTRVLNTIDPDIFQKGVQSTVVFIASCSVLPDDNAAAPSPSIIGSHILLDWILTLCNCLLPRQLPPSSKVCEHFLRIVNSDPVRMINALCTKYGLYDGEDGSGEVGDSALYEIRRRFHSLEQQHVAISSYDGSEATIENDDEEDKESDYSTADENEQGESSVSAANVCENTGALIQPEEEIDSSITPKRPKNVIDEASFVRAVSQPSNELGHGGYLTPELARWTFRACAGRAQELREALSGNLWHNSGVKDRTMINASHKRNIASTHSGDGENELYWTMYDVLSFGCEAVRFDALKEEDSDDADEFHGTYASEIPLLRLAFKTFLQLPRHQEDDDMGVEDEGDKHPLTNYDHSLMTRSQIGEMLLLLLGHESYRLKADSPLSGEGSNDMESQSESSMPWSTPRQSANGVGEEGCAQNKLEGAHPSLETFVDVSYASLLGLLPPKLEYSQLSRETSSHSIQLSKLVDYVISEANGKSGSTSTIDFRGFVRWHLHLSPSDKDGVMAMSVRETRLGPYLVDLRLIASVLFGVRPASVTIEKSLIEEIQRRHKYRYPRSRERQPHGPVGTLWYVINAEWLRTWQHCTGSKVCDGDAEWCPLVGKIENTSLLSVEGILSLKQGLHIHRDFELVEPLVWSALQAWYDGGPPITREVVPFDSRGDAPNHVGYSSSFRGSSGIHDLYDIELYPLYATVFLCDKASRGEPRPFQQFIPLSRYLPLQEIVFKLRDGLGRDSKLQRYDCRLWLLDGTNVASPRAVTTLDSVGKILDLELPITDERNQRGRLMGKDEENISLMLELRNDDGTWPRSQPKVMVGDDDDGHGVDGTSEEKEEMALGDGIVGLYNMG